jgi:hypothetical protein
MTEGSRRARKVAQETMERVRAAVRLDYGDVQRAVKSGR